jgi:hypothetical protein
MKNKYGTRYEVYTRPELYEDERPHLSWPAKIGIAVAMTAMLASLHTPLYSALTSLLPGH